jgi:hypothetical protein
MNVYQKTLLMLDACNLSGLAHSFSKEIIPAIWEDARANGGGTEQVNKHPLAVLWTMKMVDLAAGECLCERCLDAFGTAYRAVIGKVNSELVGRG